MSLLTLELAEACLAANDILINGQQDEITTLRKQVTLLREAIKIAEWGSWSNQVAFDDEADCCPVCDNLKHQGHEMLCQIKVALAATEPNQ